MKKKEELKTTITHSQTKPATAPLDLLGFWCVKLVALAQIKETSST